ncbi:hypothetical protein ACIPSA_03820 [Streptomyces sp. NPDC086549]|uniref:hypothetical protein n=1 Tax=Streptomyces sp. NPDC086549 TaxID=3365752 RepID=UPI0037FE40EB
MHSDRRLRRLVADGTEYRWTVRHRHTAGEACREVLTLYRAGVPTRIVFRAGEGRIVSGGAYWHSGLVATAGGDPLNLHEPRVVRAFVDEARQLGVLPGPAELDGWELYPAVVVRCAAAATPGAPPGCPPGP